VASAGRRGVRLPPSLKFSGPSYRVGEGGQPDVAIQADIRSTLFWRAPMLIVIRVRDATSERVIVQHAMHQD
jgi:hypothetical protein